MERNDPFPFGLSNDGLKTVLRSFSTMWQDGAAVVGMVREPRIHTKGEEFLQWITGASFRVFRVFRGIQF